MGELILAGSATPAISTVLAAVESGPPGLARRRIDGAPGFIWWPRCSLLEFHIHAAAAQSDVNTFRCGSKLHLHAVLVFYLHPRTSAGNSHASTRPDVMAVEIGQGLKIVHLTSGRASADANFTYGKATDRYW